MIQVRILQNKTQVFPLPGVAFVHNRLTHSLEVASVGRSLGKIVGEHIVKNYKIAEESKEFYSYELSNVISAACLAHDIGNPPFGHSGESTISGFFKDNLDHIIEPGKQLRHYLDNKEWEDLINFEGNANGFRFLTHKFTGKTNGGLRLTFSTIAATLKYPCESTAIDKSETVKHRSKYNVFQSDLGLFKEITETVGMIRESIDPLIYKRHPFVYLTEAADDICYRIIDMEDAHRLGILSTHEVESLFLNLIECLKVYDFNRVKDVLSKITDSNDKIGYLKAKCINALTLICADRFINSAIEILEGKFNDDLFSIINKSCSEMKEIKVISENRIYNHYKVAKIELAGYKILSELLSLFIPAILKSKPTHKDKKLINLIPNQFKVADSNYSPYAKVFTVLDFVSGMTDTYATQLYKELRGIDITKQD
ncbi:MAG: dNTP triphosphohydrolase [Bacteroidales bacterium]|nr:dNTP triphosphohydrolase [Bacteroidales bacterium]